MRLPLSWGAPVNCPGAPYFYQDGIAAETTTQNVLKTIDSGRSMTACPQKRLWIQTVFLERRAMARHGASDKHKSYSERATLQIFSDSQGYSDSLAITASKPRLCEFERWCLVGSYEKKIWVSTVYGRPDGAYFPYTPEKIFEKNLTLSPVTITAISTATGALATLESNGAVLTETEPLARLLLRSEAIASSQIEGLSVNSKKLMEREVLSELNVSQRIDSTEASVLANIHIMHERVSSIRAGDSITLEDLQAINRGVLAGTSIEHEGGKVRMQQNWIGGSSCDPVGAVCVPPAPEKVPELLEDLCNFINDVRVPVLARAALAHAQFESIHPFVDGNGRTGRALMLMVLRSGGVVNRAIPPISLSIASDKQTYLSILNGYRSEAPIEETGVVDELIVYFCQRCLDACGLATVFEKRMELLVEDWTARAHARSHSAASELIRLLPGNPVVSIQSAARLTGRSREAARNAINSLVAVGILTQNARNRKSNLYTADEVFSEFTTLERAGVTPGHDTAHGAPAKPVAQRAERPSVAGMPHYGDIPD